MIAMVLFFYAFFFPNIFADAATGYHTEYHEDHEWEYVGVVYDYDICTCGNNSVEAKRQKYVYKCNNDIYKTAFWTYYSCAICIKAWGESSIFNGHFPGDGTPAEDDVTLDKVKAENDYNNFKEHFLPDTLECPGYEVLNTYEIIYKSNGGSGTMENSSHTYNKSQKLTANSYTREGYSFNGWNTQKDGSGDSYSNKESVKNLTTKNNGKVTLYAQWTPQKYTLKVNPNGGIYKSSTDVYTFEDGLTYASSRKDSIGKSAERIGYTLKGYYTKTLGGKLIYDTSGKCVNDGTYWKDGAYIYAGDLTVYAQWTQNEYTVTYNANGGSTSAASTIYHHNDKVSLTPTASKSGYQFVGWATSPTATKPFTSFVMPDLATSDNTEYSSDWELTLYALYSIDVSDVSNHTYPTYQKVNSYEVDLTVWKTNDSSSYKRYPLTYTGDAGIMYYSYQLENTDLSSYVGGNTYEYSLIAYDNAGNFSILHGNMAPPTPKFYWQTVNHWKLDASLSNPLYFDTTSSYVEEGSSFTPAYITPPTGYEISHMDNSAYKVTGVKTTNAFYKPKTFTLYFHSNGGNNVSPSSKSIKYNDYYGELPTPTRNGHSFTGWYTAVSDGNLIKDSDTYTINENSTIYAHWNINSYQVLYDYATNGGGSASKETDYISYNSNIDLSVTAQKSGWSFVGWNTNPNATTGLTSLKMGDTDVTLYAIYKKNITATFIDSYNQTNKITTTIYNKATSCSITTRPITTITGWQPRGWSFDTQGNAAIHVSPNVTYELTEDQIFYACYVQDVTINYDTNGSAQVISSQTKERYYNALGNYVNPSFTIAAAPLLEKHTFVTWEEQDTNDIVIKNYSAGNIITADHNMTLTAKWDKHPEIEAYDRYFTLEEAINGKITADRLFEKATATDKEDGLLVNGAAVTIPYLKQYDFVNNSKVTITYQAKDSFGNVVEKNITIHIVDTTTSQSPSMYYSRFINLNFYKNNDAFVSSLYGGLESTSIWKTKEAYQRLLEYALNNEEPINSFFFAKEQLEELKIQP